MKRLLATILVLLLLASTLFLAFDTQSVEASIYYDPAYDPTIRYMHESLRDLINEYAGKAEYYDDQWNVSPSQYKSWIALITIMEAGNLRFAAHSGSLGVDMFYHWDVGVNFPFCTGIGAFQLDRGGAGGAENWSGMPTIKKIDPLESLLSTLRWHKGRFPAGATVGNFSAHSVWFAVKDSTRDDADFRRHWELTTGYDWDDCVDSELEVGFHPPVTNRSPFSEVVEYIGEVYWYLEDWEDYYPTWLISARGYWGSTEYYYARKCTGVEMWVWRDPGNELVYRHSRNYGEDQYWAGNWTGSYAGYTDDEPALDPDLVLETVLEVLHIHQTYDTPNDFVGNWACAPTSAVMILAFYGRVPPNPISVSHPSPHASNYGTYISKEYSYRDHTFSDTHSQATGCGNAAGEGAWGYIWKDSTPSSISYGVFTNLQRYLELHDFEVAFIVQPTESEARDTVKREIDSGRPLIGRTNLSGSGHYVVIVGYEIDADGNFWYLVNDPFGEKPYTEHSLGACWGNYVCQRVKYSYSDMRLNEDSRGLITIETTLFVPADLVLVLDRSGSMSGADIQGAKNAAIAVVDMLMPHDRVAVVSFASTATTNVQLTSNFEDAKTEIQKISAGGMTSFGAGLKLAVDELKARGSEDHASAIIFMSDGHHNTSPAPDPYVEECKNLGIPIYTLGFGSYPGAVDEARLKWMAEETGGQYLFAPTIYEMENVFLMFTLEATGWPLVGEFIGTVAEDETVEAGTFDVEPGTDSVRVTLNWPGSDLDLVIERPDGSEVDLGTGPDNIYSGDEAKPEWAILLDPPAGTWTVKVYGRVVNPHADYIVWVSTYVPPTPPVITVYVDIRPGGWPNPLNIGSRGVFPVVICGTEALNVTAIDPSAVAVYVEGAEEGVSPIRWSYEDVATPYTGEPRGGHDLEGDGYLDLVFHFSTQAVVTGFDLDGHVGETILLTIAGSLHEELGGTPVEGQDYVWLLGPGR